MTRAIIGDGPNQVISRGESSRATNKKTIKTKQVQCSVCLDIKIVPSKPSILDKVLAAGCLECKKLESQRKASEEKAARQARELERAELLQIRDQKRLESLKRVCKYCGVEWVVAHNKGHQKGHGSRCYECRLRDISDRVRQRTYGLDADLLEAMMGRPDLRCENPGCQKPLQRRGGPRDVTPVIDHCHASGQVRGVLCTQCNIALGMLGDDPGRILGLHVYLAAE